MKQKNFESEVTGGVLFGIALSAKIVPPDIIIPSAIIRTKVESCRKAPFLASLVKFVASLSIAEAFWLSELFFKSIRGAIFSLLTLFAEAGKIGEDKNIEQRSVNANIREVDLDFIFEPRKLGKEFISR